MWQEDDTSESFFPDDERDLEGSEPSFADQGYAEESFADESLAEGLNQDADDKPKTPPPAQFPANFFPRAALPNVVPMMDIYEAARARAIADQQLSKLFNPEYYI